MTNKPMLSVERELLESFAAYVADCPNAVMRARVAQLRALLDKPALSTDVRTILLDVVPGDGSGHEVYATSCADVEAVLSALSQRIEELEAAQPHGEPVVSGYDLDRIENALDGLDPDEYCEGVDVHDIGMLLQAVRTLQVRQILSEPDEQPEPVRWERMSEMQGGTWWPCANKAEADQAVNCGWTVRPLYADRQPTNQRYSMHTVMLALERSKERITLTSNQCHALAQALNEGKI